MRFFMFSEKSIFDPILAPTWLHFGTQNPTKSTQKSIPRSIQKMIDFFRLMFYPSWLRFRTQVGTQEALKTVPKRLQDAPKTPPRHFKSHKSTQNQNLIDFSSDPGGYPIGRSDGVCPLHLIFKVCWPMLV